MHTLFVHGVAAGGGVGYPRAQERAFAICEELVGGGPPSLFLLLHNPAPAVRAIYSTCFRNPQNDNTEFATTVRK